MNRLMICAAAAALALCGCKAKDATTDKAVTATPAGAAAPAAAATPALPVAPKSGFDVAVSLSPKAAAKLAAIHESITVAAEFYGEVTDEGRKHHLGDQMDQVYFGKEQKNEISGAGGTTHFDPPPGDPDKLKYVTGAKMQVLINVYTARHVDKDNLLDCGIFQDAVDVAEQTPIKISCKLIGEGEN
jgi:hypothetical protein